MKVIVLMNASAAESEHEADVLAAVELLRSRGLDVDLWRARPGAPLPGGSDPADSAARAARLAVAGGVSAVIAAGGDGTVGTVAGALAGTGTPMGVLPAGTLNHFARDLGLPATVPAAAAVLADALAAGRVRAVDVGEVNGRVFVNNSSIGLYPRIVVRRDRRLRRWRRRERRGAGAGAERAALPPAFALRLGRGKWLAMLLAAVSVFRRHTALTLRLDADGTAALLHTPFVFVGNNFYPTDLFDLGQRTRLDGGELCLYAARRAGRFALLRLALRAVLGLLRQDADFTATGVHELKIDSRHKVLRVALDGEVVPLHPPLLYRMRPRALKVLTG